MLTAGEVNRSDKEVKMTTLSIAELFNLRGKVALVTGGAMGIGEGIVTRLAESGATVMISDINGEAVHALAGRLRDRGLRVGAITADVSVYAETQRMVAETVQAFGRLDILVNNAGVFPFSPVPLTTEQLWDRVLDINLKGAFFSAQAAAHQMISAGHGGTIINIASIDAFHPTPNLVHYDTSKGGLVMMTKSLALELGPAHITVNAIAPGAIRTPGASATAPGSEMTPEQMAAITAAFLARIPLGRQGEPDDIARVALFLASPAAAYMTGATLVVDGGYLLS